MNNSKKKYNNRRSKKKIRAMDIVYLMVILLVFEAAALMFFMFPRSTESELERRELASFPEFSSESYLSGDYTAALSAYFSDTVPFRDDLTTLSMSLRGLTGFAQSGITLHGVGGEIKEDPSPTASSPEPQSTPAQPADTAESGESSESGLPFEETQETAKQGNHDIEEINPDTINPDDAVNITNNGIAVVGTRALMLYGGSFEIGKSYAEVINRYKELLGEDVNVYSMVIPTAVEFYCPDEVKPYTGSELANINNIIDNLSDSVKAVDVYTTLAKHANEDIFLRTDHHWAPLGAYYAAKEFAAAAGVPFLELSEYEQKVVHDYVGTMYAYSEDITIKNNPEDFVYYVPTGVDYTTTYYNYDIDSSGNIKGVAEPYEGNFFIKYGDGNGMAYCTFMGGDSKITHVHTSTGNGKKLAIIKDSFGNALPGYLFGSFEDIYVIDMRYFTYNAIDYFTENGITDVLFANNAFHAATASTVKYYNNFLTQ